MDTEETKHAAFRRLATKRLNKAVKLIRLLGNLPNKNNYRYEKSDVRKIFSALEKEMRVARLKFTMNTDNSDEIKI